jgi:hypothetical protein
MGRISYEAEAMLRDLHPDDARRHRLETALAARHVVEARTGATPDLRAEAEVTLSDLGGTRAPPAQSELPNDRH